jgi:hypothetical protein
VIGLRPDRPLDHGRNRRRAVVAIGMATFVWSSVLVPLPAFAYVRYLSKSGCPYSWRSRSLSLIVYPQGLPDMTPDQIERAATRAATAWNRDDPALASCTDLSLSLTMRTLSDAPPAAKFDGENHVTLRGDCWCSVCSVDGTAPVDCHDPNALAITSVFARGDGEIVDADVEVNAVMTSFRWGDLDVTPPDSGRQDLQNALTHELGHFIGLDHTCYDGDPAKTRAKDETGQFIPDCFRASAAVLATTMFPSANPGDTSKRTLEPDDQKAVCDIYPAGAADPNACEATDRGGGCEIASSVPAAPARGTLTRWAGWGSIASGFALVAFLARRRARRRR